MNKLATSKETLLEIARDISYREGTPKVGIRRLASESRAAIETVYGYYPSKTDLVAEIMEGFWKSVSHGSHFDTESGDSLGSVEEIYRRFSVNLAVFERESLEGLLAMERAEQEKSHVIEQKYIQHMKVSVLRILEKDGRADTRMWMEEFTPKMLVDFTFSNIVLALSEGREDRRHLLWVLERLLCGTTSG